VHTGVTEVVAGFGLEMRIVGALVLHVVSTSDEADRMSP
jgi:hypothetical protein